MKTIQQSFARLLLIALVSFGLGNVGQAQESELAADAKSLDKGRPNIVFIMSDELAYYELSHMGNTKIHTPNIDQMAREGIRFTRALAAAPVCGPLRCCLMTGKHMGHASMRTDGGGTPIRADEPTIASMLKARGYATGGFGKWGIGGRGSEAVPETHGFDEFFGYYDQVHAHSFYTPHLIRNSKEVPLAGNLGGRKGETHSHYEIMKEGLKFIRKNKDQPFFCYLPITPPHGMFDIPSDDPAFELYKNDAWMQDPEVSQDAKNYAAMVSMIDNDLKRVLDLLKELSVDDNTIVFFTGDNGGENRFKSDDHPHGFFGPNVNPATGVRFRGKKRELYEGGLRIPFLVRWPGKIKVGHVSDHLFYQVDLMATLAELTGSTVPVETDGLSIAPTLVGAEAVGHAQEQHRYMYWEYQKQVAVRKGTWKAIKPNPKSDWELYDMSTDISESTNVAADHESLVAEIAEYAKSAHVPAKPGKFLRNDLQKRDRAARNGVPEPIEPAIDTIDESIKHSFIGVGRAAGIVIVGESGKVQWRVKRPASDAWVLDNGNVLAALYPSKGFPAGGVAEIDRKTKELVWSYKGQQQEISTVQQIGDNEYLVAELGATPKAIVINRSGEVLREMAFQCQTGNSKREIHMQTRMLRLLPNGNYLAPHLLDFAVKEYNSSTGEVVRSIATDDRGREKRDWPFSAIRLDNGNTLISCTNGNRVIEVDGENKIVWSVDNKDLGWPIISDACGSQRLSNGNTVIASYRARNGKVKLLEVTPDKKVVWKFDGLKSGFHHFQILTTSGEKLSSTMK